MTKGHVYSWEVTGEFWKRVEPLVPQRERDPGKQYKRSLGRAAKAAGLEDISAHVLRHTTAVWMAETGIAMEEISQYLGHANTSITERVYARYSPDHLRSATSALEIGDNVVPTFEEKTTAKFANKFTEPKECYVDEGKNPIKSVGYLVSVTGIEPVTPTMST